MLRGNCFLRPTNDKWPGVPCKEGKNAGLHFPSLCILRRITDLDERRSEVLFSAIQTVLVSYPEVIFIIDVKSLLRNGLMVPQEACFVTGTFAGSPR